MEEKNKWESQSILFWLSVTRTSPVPLLFTVLHIAAGSSSLIILLFIQSLATEGAAIPWDSVSLETAGGVSGEEMKTAGGACSLPRGSAWCWESVISQNLQLICQRGTLLDTRALGNPALS